MAELVGTIVGVVSLGLQVCSGINVYLGGIQGRKEDVASTVRHCKTTEILLKQTDSIRGRLASLPGANTTALQESISAANTELSLLEAYVKKIHTEAPPASSKSVVAKFKEQEKRLLYPFRRDHLNLLDSRLERANEALQGALQLAGLEVSFDSNDSLRGMETTLGTLAQGFSETSVEVRTSIVELKETTMLSRQYNQAILEGIAELATMMSALSSSGAGALLPRMVSKPDTLKRVCDNVEVVESSISVHQSSYSEARSSLAMRSSDDTLSIYPESYCRCNARRVTRHRKHQFGPAFILKKDVVERAHLNDCPFAAFDVDKTSNC
ncbi:hypothetical protein QIS74_07417 [Colletotrichum tabaci]|uniref:Fungal N-terminal domain-containing protein n=1 Tax=Colletotrichum tabaci TaxID=1209068 RepID=A0AAV9TBC5_9PEZI